MRRIVLGLAGAVVAIGVVLGALVVRMPPGAIETELLAALGSRPELTVVARGPTDFALFPTPHVSLRDVSIADGAGATVATVRTLTATPRLKGLIAGRVEIDEITLTAPTLKAEALDMEALTDLLGRRRDARARMPSLRIVDGAVTWAAGRVDGVEAGVVWPRVGRALALTGSGRFRGRSVELAAAVDDPAALARGERSGVKAKLTGGDVRLAFDGEATRPDGARRLDGTLRIRAASLKDAARWFGGVEPALGAALADVTLSGRAGIDRSGVAVEGAELGVDGANFVGSARFALKDGRPRVEATLDTRALDVTRYLDGFGAPLGENGGWSAAPLDVRPFRALDLDLRLSADAVMAGPVTLGPTAATVTVADGALDVAVGEAEAYGGSLSGRATVEPDGRTARVRLQVRALDVDVAKGLADIFGSAPFSGALTGDVTLDGRGAALSAIVRDLSGSGSVQVQGGAIGGFRARALTLLGLGATLDVTSAEATLAIAGGVARTEDLILGGPSAELRLSGEADLSSQRLALGGTLAAAGGGLRAPVRVEGAFADPKLRLGARVPERRSEAPSARPAQASAAR